MCAERCRHVLLTGSPGSGKTTLIIKVYKKLQEKNIEMSGFYTKEVREGNKRQGFDVITLDGEQSVLARIGILTPAYKRNKLPAVGQYLVDLDSFERTANKTLQLKETKHLFVVDEIGKMELFSHAFADSVKQLFSSDKATVLGTIPISRGKPLKMVEEIRSRDDVKIFEICKLLTEAITIKALPRPLCFGSAIASLSQVTKQNRDHLEADIIHALTNCHQP